MLWQQVMVQSDNKTVYKVLFTVKTSDVRVKNHAPEVYSNLEPTGGSNPLMTGRAASWKAADCWGSRSKQDNWHTFCLVFFFLRWAGGRNYFSHCSSGPLVHFTHQTLTISSFGYLLWRNKRHCYPFYYSKKKSARGFELTPWEQAV